MSVANAIYVTSNTPVYIGEDGGSLYYDTGSGRISLSGPVTINEIDSGVGHIYLQTDININQVSDYFIGGSGSFVFDGQGHAVTLDSAVANYGGLFSVLNTDQTIQNVDVGGLGTLANQAGAIVGVLQQGHVIHCSSSIDISADGAGGIAGSNASGTIEGCYSTGAISGRRAGGIVGEVATYASGGSLGISDCYTTGTISGFYAGGIGGAYAAINAGNLSISDCFTVGSIVGDAAGGLLGGFAGESNGSVLVTNSYTTGNTTGVHAGGIVGAYGGYSSGNVTIYNVFSTGSIQWQDSGGIAGLTNDVVTVSHAYTSGSGNQNGIFAYYNANGDDNPFGPDVRGVNNYSEANNGNSGVWTDVNALQTLVLGSNAWVHSYAPGTPYTLAAFSPTVDSTSALSGASAGAVYDLTFADLMAASDASSQFNTVQSFEVTANPSSGAFYSGTSYGTATRFYGTETLDATHHIYWVPNQTGAVDFGSALAVGYNAILNQSFNSATSTQIAFSIPSPVTPSNTINVGGFILTQQNMLLNPDIICNTSILQSKGVCNANGGYATSSPLNTVSTCLLAGTQAGIKQLQVQNFLNEATTDLGSAHSYNYCYLNDFQQSGNFNISSGNSSTSATNFLNVINNKWTTETIDLTGYQGIVLVNGGVNLTGITSSSHVGALGKGTYSFAAGNQELCLLGPNAIVNGGAGVDTVNLLGVNKNAATINRTGNDLSIWSNWLEGGSGVTTLHNIARVKFDDVSVAFDTGAGQSAGSVFRLYEAAFHREGDLAGMGYWINQMDNGAKLIEVANSIANSTEFVNLYGGAGNTPVSAAFLTALYNNVLGRAPDQGGYAYWLNAGLTKAQTLLYFAESQEGVAHAANLVANGIAYQPWVH